MTVTINRKPDPEALSVKLVPVKGMAGLQTVVDVPRAKDAPKDAVKYVMISEKVFEWLMIKSGSKSAD